jgi:Mn2+/Fe2+ NRAMP family transporter
MKKWFSLALGIVTATGGFLDIGTIATAGEAGARFGLGLIWVVLISTIAVILLVEMVGRFTAVSQKTYADAIREDFGIKFYLLPLSSEIIAESLLLAAELGGMAIALSLLTGISWHLLFPVAVLLVFVMAWRASFDWIENGPALFGLLALSFVAGIFALGGPSRETITTLWKLPVRQNEVVSYLYLAAATLGATVSPYLLHFYSSGAREENWSGSSLLLNRVTAILGMGFGSLGSMGITIIGAIALRPQQIQVNTLGEIGLAMAQAFGSIGPVLFAVVLFVTCLGAALEALLALSYNVAQGFGWAWGENKAPRHAARFNLVIILFLSIATVIGMLGIDPLQLALFASTIIALFLPISLFPFLVLMNNPQYLKGKTNGRISNLFLLGILLIAFVVAIISLPLELLSGGR